jgi:glycerol-3-phosphate dehydrogenase (NAD(P)+)
MSSQFRVYATSDVVGLELAGALKNVIAIAAGIADGMGHGSNGKAAFLTRGLVEMARIGQAAGADSRTFSGLAGLGDLVATCFSPLSRNRHVGEQIGRGRALEEILRSLDHVAEGVATTRAARDMARRLGIEAPITEQAYRVLFDGLAPEAALAELMSRQPRYENDDALSMP